MMLKQRHCLSLNYKKNGENVLNHNFAATIATTNFAEEPNKSLFQHVYVTADKNKTDYTS